MLKASWGGGGRGMRVIESDAQLAELLPRGAARGASRLSATTRCTSRSSCAARATSRCRSSAIATATLVHLFERDCTVQRRNQKVVERAPAVFLTDEQRDELCAAALAIGARRRLPQRRHGRVPAGRRHAASFYFIEVNPRIQVEHTVTECATGIDLVKAQIRIAGGARIGTPESGVPPQEQIRISAHALQCRITTEDPENNFIPDYGTHHRLSQPGRLRRAPGRRHRLHRRDHHALLRLAAGEGDRLVADAGGNHRAHAPRAVGVPHPRRGHEPALPRPAHHASALRAG